MSYLVLSDDTVKEIGTGEFLISAEMTSGTASLQIQTTAGGTFYEPAGANFTSVGGVVATLPDCNVKAVLTGDATITLARINTDKR